MASLPETVLEIFSGIPRGNFVSLRWMSGMSANLCRFRAIFNFGNSQKSQEAKSDK
jgi:hypothetical protein